MFNWFNVKFYSHSNMLLTTRCFSVLFSYIKIHVKRAEHTPPFLRFISFSLHIAEIVHVCVRVCMCEYVPHGNSCLWHIHTNTRIIRDTLQYASICYMISLPRLLVFNSVQCSIQFLQFIYLVFFFSSSSSGSKRLCKFIFTKNRNRFRARERLE